MDHPSTTEAGVLSVDEARTRILDGVERLAPLELPLQEAMGCVLAADVVAEFDLPEFSSATADGFAVRAADVHAASAREPVTLTIVGKALVGRTPDATVGWGEAVRISAGAPTPAGSDCVIPLARAVIEGETVRILTAVRPDTNVSASGHDVRAGEILIPARRKIGVPEVALLAATGHPSALVHPRVRAVVLSIGDELVDPGRPAAFGQVRDAASLTLFAAVKELGGVPYLTGIVRDDPEAFKEEVLSHLITADCYIAAGGTATADHEALRTAFFKRGQVDTLRVGMDPAPPQAFGVIEGKPLFALPGDPVSVFVCFEVFVRPALLKMMGRTDLARPEVRAMLTEDIGGPDDADRFARVRVSMREGRWTAEPTGEAGSLLVGSLAGTNGLAVVPAGTHRAYAGGEARVIVLRPLDR